MGKVSIATHCGDCLDVMPTLSEGSIDLIVADLPYNLTSAAWDSMIPFDDLWREFKRILKPHGAVILFGVQPFTSRLVMSNLPWYRHSWIWKKNNHCNPLQAKRQPLRITEDILVFAPKPPRYYPQGIEIVNAPGHQGSVRSELVKGERERPLRYHQHAKGYPKNILEFSHERPRLHPTQKPVGLLEYLIETYTEPGDVVLDPTMGSGSTGVAAMQAGRGFVGIELDQEYYAVAVERMAAAGGDQ